MAGVRIQHPTERNCTFTLVDASQPYVAPVNCGLCSLVHQWKTYHFRLDETGAAIVSREIIERLQRLPGNGGFAIANEVRKPPPTFLDLRRPLERTTVIAHPELKEPT